MLLHEPGGHFKFHRDTVKEDVMFVTLIIQLPTQTGHEGGLLTVQHGDSSKTFDFRSKNGFFYTLFFCDCKHELSKITRGYRVCLVFSLLKKSTSFLPADKPAFFLATRPRVEFLLRQWVDSRDRKLMIILLGHRYSQIQLSFTGLKGHDRAVADLVRRCEFLEVHLCTLTKKEYVENYRKVKADFRAALVASCFLGAFPPVDLRAVCLVRVIFQSKEMKKTWMNPNSEKQMLE